MPNGSDIRVRFAPSPTGDPHIGSMWTALYNWLFAKANNGTFILRIEDTDRQRLVPGSMAAILQALDWYNLEPDEGPGQGGPYAPYVQSERLDRYRGYAETLVAKGAAYYCFCSPERLEQLRATQTAAKQPPRYDKHCATLEASDVQSRLAAGEAHTIRLNMPSHGTVTVNDSIRGQVEFRYDLIDDSVILKSDGYPTYHLANVVDDHDMKISHVIRAEEWLPSVPKHLFLYASFGWTPPTFAHLPLLLGSDRAKLSKRHGATSALSFRDEGYVPAAMINFMALMGWHPKGDEEVLSLQDIIAQFRLEDVNPAGAVFDRTKLDWLNGVYIRAMSRTELLTAVEPFWHRPADEVSPQRLEEIIGLIHDRLVKLADIDGLINFIFPSVWDSEVTTMNRELLVPKKGSLSATQHHLEQSAKWLEQYDGEWTAAALKEQMIAAIAAMGKKNGEILWPIRVALSLRAASPDVFDLLAVLGKTESLRRLNHVAV
jgi:glutamyl-tRNA synthetase